MGKIRLAQYRIQCGSRTKGPSEPVRIAVLADLHNRVYRSDAAALVKMIRRIQCDAVLSAGDLVLMKGGHFETDVAVALLTELAGMLPVYVTNGNHETRMARRHTSEYTVYERKLHEAGVNCLHNQSADVQIKGMKLTITGLELDYRYFRNRYHKDLSVEEICDRVGARSKDSFHILLAHHPKFFPAYAGWGADLTLSGHLHGGIVRLPFLGGAISPDPALFPQYDHGLYEKDASRMIVSAGLGTHTVNLRVNNPAELVVVEITNGNRTEA